MAGRGGTVAVSMAQGGSSRMWEDLRKEARKLEGELDFKLASYSKLGAGASGDAEAPDLVSTTKAVEIEELLRRLLEVNDAMANCVNGGGSDVLTHTLARHRDILHEFTEEFKRARATMAHHREHAELLGGFGGGPAADIAGGSFLGVPGGAAAGGMGREHALLRERGSIHSSTAQLDDVLGQAQQTISILAQQRSLFTDIGAKINAVGAKFPLVNSVMNQIKRKKSKDTIILASVIAGCTLFTLIYWLSK
eukprot:jgi/Mesvir1/25028/Mv16968-RA.1